MSKQILIADDSASIREILTFILQNAGYQVLQACDGKDALKYFDGRPIDLLLTDYHMPNLNGLELTVQVRQIDNYKYIPILVLTTETQNEKIKEALPVQQIMMSKAEAEKTGAFHFFGDKYGDQISVYFVGKDIATAFSKEFHPKQAAG